MAKPSAPQLSSKATQYWVALLYYGGAKSMCITPLNLATPIPLTVYFTLTAITIHSYYY